MSLRSILKQSSETRIYHSRDLNDATRGFELPEQFRLSPSGFDSGRPSNVNLKTVTDYFSDDILATDRLFLPVENRLITKGGRPLFNFQRIIMKEAVQKQFLWLQMMRGGAKTYTLARFAIDYALMVPNTPIVITAPSFRQALMMFDNGIQIIERNSKDENWPVRIGGEIRGEIKRNALESIIKFHNGSSIMALPMGDGSKIRGIRGGVLIIDEFYQITEEMYESHILPFVQVKQGGRDSKVIHATTSWYQDCFAYKRLQQIASEVKAGNPAYGILDFNLKDLLDCGFPLSEAIWRDAQRHGNKQTFAMTYFNLWPTTSARWFEQRYIDQALSNKNAVRIEMKPVEETETGYFGVIDLAASEKGDSTFAIVFKYDKKSSKYWPVWAHKEKGLGPSERAWLVHTIEQKFNPTFIIYDAHGAIGTDLRADLAKRELLINGEIKQIIPLVHHDAYGLSGKHVLVPVAVSDKAVQEALVGPRDGTTLRGEAGMKEALLTKCRDLLMESHLVGPATASEGDGNTLYDGSEMEVLDIIREAFNQLGAIGLKKDKDGIIQRTQSGELLFETRAGMSDDGAYCLVYSAIGYQRVIGTGVLNERGAPRSVKMGMTFDEIHAAVNMVPEENIQKLRFA